MTASTSDYVWYTYGGGGHSDRFSAYYLAPGYDCCMPCAGPGAPVAITLGQWTCLEWQFDGAQNEMRLWADGVLIPELTVSGATTAGSCVGATFTGGVFDQVSLGWAKVNSEDAGTMDMWLDDVSIDTQRIGCGP
jgi:hypothetical protein